MEISADSALRRAWLSEGGKARLWKRKGGNSGWNRTSPPHPFFPPSFSLRCLPAPEFQAGSGDSRPPSCPGAAEMSALVKLGPFRNIQQESLLLEPTELNPERFLQRFFFFFKPSADKRRDIAVGVYFFALFLRLQGFLLLVLQSSSNNNFISFHDFMFSLQKNPRICGEKTFVLLQGKWKRK